MASVNGLPTFALELMRTGAMDIVLAEIGRAGCVLPARRRRGSAGAHAASAGRSRGRKRRRDRPARRTRAGAGECRRAGLFRALLPVDRRGRKVGAVDPGVHRRRGGLSAARSCLRSGDPEPASCPRRTGMPRARRCRGAVRGRHHRLCFDRVSWLELGRVHPDLPDAGGADRLAATDRDAAADAVRGGQSAARSRRDGAGRRRGFFRDDCGRRADPRHLAADAWR